MRLPLLIPLLALAGCGPPAPRQINPGAIVPVYVGTHADVVAELIRRGGEYVPNQTRQSGFYDRERKEIWLVGRPGDADVLRAYTHEVLIHFVADQGGDPLTAAARLTSPKWDVRYGDSPAEVTAMATALATARDAQ
jgi:hypothetical protein